MNFPLPKVMPGSLDVGHVERVSTLDKLPPDASRLADTPAPAPVNAWATPKQTVDTVPTLADIQDLQEEASIHLSDDLELEKADAEEKLSKYRYGGGERVLGIESIENMFKLLYGSDKMTQLRNSANRLLLAMSRNDGIDLNEKSNGQSPFAKYLVLREAEALALKCGSNDKADKLRSYIEQMESESGGMIRASMNLVEASVKFPKSDDDVDAIREVYAANIPTSAKVKDVLESMLNRFGEEKFEAMTKNFLVALGAETKLMSLSRSTSDVRLQELMKGLTTTSGVFAALASVNDFRNKLGNDGLHVDKSLVGKLAISLFTMIDEGVDAATLHKIADESEIPMGQRNKYFTLLAKCVEQFDVKYWEEPSYRSDLLDSIRIMASRCAVALA